VAAPHGAATIRPLVADDETCERRAVPEILLVDDDPDLADNLAEVLRGEGFDVVVAASGAAALAHLRGGLRPGAIVLDLLMADGDGWEFRRQQGEDPALAAIPVIVISAVVEFSRPIAPMMLGKPVNVPLLVKELRRLAGGAAP
jgi:CheY-like chemotaxis protein